MQNHNNTNQDDPQIPQPDLRFVSKATKQQANGARPNKKHPQMICRKIQRQESLYPNQKHAVNELTTTKQYQLMLHGHLSGVEPASLSSQKVIYKSESIVTS